MLQDCGQCLFSSKSVATMMSEWLVHFGIFHLNHGVLAHWTPGSWCSTMGCIAGARTTIKKNIAFIFPPWSSILLYNFDAQLYSIYIPFFIERLSSLFDPPGKKGTRCNLELGKVYSDLLDYFRHQILFPLLFGSIMPDLGGFSRAYFTWMTVIHCQHSERQSSIPDLGGLWDIICILHWNVEYRTCTTTNDKVRHTVPKRKFPYECIKDYMC